MMGLWEAGKGTREGPWALLPVLTPSCRVTPTAAASWHKQLPRAQSKLFATSMVVPRELHRVPSPEEP